MESLFGSKTNTLTADGRLTQVEFAVEAINKGAAVIGIKTIHGIVFIMEKRTAKSELIDNSPSLTVSNKKVKLIDLEHLAAFAGLASDAETLLEKMRKVSDNYRLSFGCRPNTAYLAQNIAFEKQNKTQLGGLRPYGVSMLCAGFDKVSKRFELLATDPSGSFNEFQALAIGNENNKANLYLQKEYTKDCDLQKGIVLGFETMFKVVGKSGIKSDKIDICTLTEIEGEIQINIWKEDEIKKIITKIKLANEEENK